MHGNTHALWSVVVTSSQGRCPELAIPTLQVEFIILQMVATLFAYVAA